MLDSLRLHRGRPDDEQLAALVAVLRARETAPSATAAPAAPARWRPDGFADPRAWRAAGPTMP
ncbi:acyl-CoA carboxylase epsilon subunit [Amorphoplanes digitatis]|uniref:Acyl-CoA carboxylase subunit epsilon n=1 Tax=Actinoplanes digitatis TaxID=1868 RepID=A0A7W7MRN3_9ACTN|nr:acyl-CoA carboxylase epsilon subunit [Actinoplanes digitatis]MBB4764438.1 hypothetical protein [Actinoplanes digitatis]GID94075.1 hypothetical protein Adi01nite_34870 [Actinoplanes digitatis]